MASLYEQNPEPWDRVAAYGHINIRELAKHVYSISEMEEIMGTRGGVRHWASSRTIPRRDKDHIARMWLEGRRASDNVAPTPAPTSAPTPTASGEPMFLVVPPVGGRDRVEKVLTMMGCEIVEV